MKILYDYHMHSEISPDAHFSMEAMCESALKNGMREIAFTDHYEFYVNGVVRPWFNERYVDPAIDWFSKPVAKISDVPSENTTLSI